MRITPLCLAVFIYYTVHKNHIHFITKNNMAKGMDGIEEVKDFKMAAIFSIVTMQKNLQLLDIFCNPKPYLKPTACKEIIHN
mgnify:CR=1 FL=1